MDNKDLIGVLESLLGPAVAGSLNVPSAHSRASRLSGSPDRAARGTLPPGPRAVQGGSVTALLGAEMPVGLAVLDARTMYVTRTNAALVSLLGEHLREADIVGRPLAQVAPGLAGSEVEAAFLRVAHTGRPFSAIVEEEQPSGSVYRRCSLSPVRRADGSYDDLLLTLLDVTDQIQARQRADIAVQRAEERASRVEEQAQLAGLRTAAVQALAHVSDLSSALGRVVERTTETLGDCCAIFLLGEDDVLQLGALHHRDRVEGFRLRASYYEHPSRRGEGVAGQVVLSGDAHLVSHWSRENLGFVAAAHRATADAEHIESLVCVPLREAARTLGALMVFSVQTSAGGSGHTFTGSDLAFLQELADQIAQTVQNARLREALRASMAEKEALLEICTEGIAIYDGQGRLRHLNAAGRRLLSRTAQPAVERGSLTGNAKRAFLSAEGRRLAPSDLPWSRALRGERVGDDALEPIIVEWQDGLQRMLGVRAMPVEDASGIAVGAVVMLADPTQYASVFGESVAQEAEQAGVGSVEWARWRETMELLDDGVVLCGVDGAAVFVNKAGRALLNLPESTPNEDVTPGMEPAMDTIWQDLRRPDGSPLPPNETPAARALAGWPVRELETVIAVPGGGFRRIFWDARRIDRDTGEPLGVVLIAQTATEASPGTEAGYAGDGESPMDRRVASARPELAATTLLSGRVVPEHREPEQDANGVETSDLAEVCARVARQHGGAQGRRLEIRLPRRRVLVQAQEALLESAVDALIASGAAVMPPAVPLHVAVWVERAGNESARMADSPVPPGVGVDQINTVRLKPGESPLLAAPTRLVTRPSGNAQQDAVAVVRICSPGLGKGSDAVDSSLEEPDDFLHCRELVTSVGGRAWAREDPLLGPTYSLSIPLAHSEERQPG